MGSAQLACFSAAHQKTLIQSPALAAPKLAILALSHIQHHVLCTVFLTGFVSTLSAEDCPELARI